MQYVAFLIIVTVRISFQNDKIGVCHLELIKCISNSNLGNYKLIAPCHFDIKLQSLESMKQDGLIIFNRQLLNSALACYVFK